MRWKKQIKRKARALRSRGKTYAEIVEYLGVSVSKSTISNWCSKVTMPAWYQNKVAALNTENFSKAQKIAWASNKAKRERLLCDLLSNNRRIISKIKDKDVLKALLSVLYLGEGAKWKSHRGLMLGSSDQDIIKLYIHLIDLCYGIKPASLKCRVSYRADQNIVSLQKYWSQITSIPVRNFYKTIPDPRTIGRPTKRKDYKGVCVIMCGGTHIQLELEAIPKLILKGL